MLQKSRASKLSETTRLIRLNDLKFYFLGFLIQGAIIWASLIKYLNINVRYQRYSTLLIFFFFFAFHQSTCGGGGIREPPRQLKEQLQAQALPPCTRTGQV
jgi:hypothetical protein